MRRLRIYHLLAGHKWTGPAEGVVTLCRDLARRGHDVRLYSAPNPRRLLADQAALRGVTPETDLHLDPKRPFSLAADIGRLTSILRRDRPDILHVHLSADHWIGALAARWAGGSTRIVRTIHHPNTLEPKWFRRRLYRRGTDGFTALCARDRERLIREFSVDPDTVAVIHGAVDAARFTPNVEARLGQAQFGLKTTTPVIGMVARFQPHRRHELMISALSRLEREFPTVRLLLVGRGEHLPAVEQFARDRGQAHRVIFAGYRDKDLPEMYAAMDVMVMLAAGSDGSCRAALEAMATARPVVGFPVGALPETVVDGVSGFIVPDGDEARLAERLAELLSDRRRAQAMGLAARKRIEEEFTESGRAEATEGFYRSLLGSTPAQRSRDAVE